MFEIEHTFDVGQFLFGNIVEDAATVTAILRNIHEALADNPALRQRVDLVVTPRNQRRRTGLQRLLQYRGPDHDTCELLYTYHPHWFNNPQDFWQVQFHPELSQLDPQAQIRCVCVMFAEYRSQNVSMTSTEIADMVCQAGLFQVSYDVVKSTADRMSRSGSYYRSLELALGAGSTLALGTVLAEETWTRVVTKRGTNFNAVVDHLRSTALAQMAQQYSALRRKLTNFQLDRLQSGRQAYRGVVPLAIEAANVTAQSQGASVCNDGDVDSMIAFVDGQPFNLQEYDWFFYDVENPGVGQRIVDDQSG